MKIKDYFKKCAFKVDQALDRYLDAKGDYPQVIHEAVRYAVLSGGKRIRPILVIASAESLGLSASKVMPAACAVEMIHAYSLVHDDLPCMDDDDYRRGKPTLHKKYDEAIAVLAGDTLLTKAFETIAKQKPLALVAPLVMNYAIAAGSKGMIGGQVVDKEYETKKLNLETMDYIHQNKTGQLITASCVAGAICANATAQQKKMLRTYGEHLGFVFQLIDDIIDQDGYVRFAGVDACLKRAEKHTQKAIQIAKKLPKNQETLIEIANFVLNRRK